MIMAMGDVEIDYAKLCSELELQEQEAANCVAAPQVYCQLLAIYLLQRDLANAKFLWKRIPAAIKNANPELAVIWAVGQKMWQRDFPGTYENLKKEWSDGLRPIMDAVLDATRKRAFNLVARAYSCISVEDLCAFVGMAASDAIDAAQSRGWKVDATTQTVTPCLPEKPLELAISSEQQLNQLTDFVSFLEN